MDQYPTLDRTILTDLQDMLTNLNPFISIYKTARERLADRRRRAVQRTVFDRPSPVKALGGGTARRGSESTESRREGRAEYPYYS